MKSPIQKFSLAGGLVLAACTGALAADPFMLKSSAFEDNGKLAVKHAGNNKQNPNCVGEYGIDASVTGFAEGEVGGPSEKYVGGKGQAGLGHYLGPCTPPGDWHHYTFTLIATDLEPKALQPGLTRDELFKALDGHAKGAAGLIGRFTKP